MADSEERLPPDPWGNHRFALEINGNQIAEFMEASGIRSTAAVFEIAEGGYNGHIHKRPGTSKWENIVLKNATHASTALMEWRDKYLTDGFTAGPRLSDSGSIVLYGNNHVELRRYNFIKAWPVSWEGPGLNGGGSELAIETLEIAHDGIYINGVPVEPPPEPPPPRPPERLDLPPVQFEYDSAVLTDEGRDVVSEAAKQIKKFEITEMWIEGHTCTMGSFAYNQSLSARRAASVVTELRKKGATDTVYTSQGFAWKYPVASNASTGGKEANRRTEFMTTSFESRGWNADPVKPENQKANPPWNHK